MTQGTIDLTTCAIVFAIWFLLSMSPLPHAIVHAQTCPPDARGWKTWRDDTIATAFSQVTQKDKLTLVNYEKFLSFSRSVRDFGIQCLGSNRNTITVPSELRNVIGNFFSFFGAIGLESQENHRFGMTVTDVDYLNAIQNVIKLPPLLTSQEFLRAVSDRKTYHKALELIQTHNTLLPDHRKWIPLIYKSRFLTTPDNSGTYGRFFVLVPGAVDKWIQFGILTPDMQDVRVNNLSIVAVRRLTDVADGSPRTETFIVDYWRDYRPSPTRGNQHHDVVVQTKLEAGQGTENCSECHKTPVLGIHPDTVYEFDKTGRLVPLSGPRATAVPDLLNSLIADYGPPNYRGWQPQTQYGPPLGPLNQQRPDSFFNACATSTGVTAASYDILRNAMTCATCHDTTLLGRINFPQAADTTREFALIHPDTKAVSPLVDTYVGEGWMPPGSSLSPAERKAVTRCLKHEYLNLEHKTGLLIDWLKGKG